MDETLEEVVQRLQTDRDRQRQDFDRLRREYDALAGKLRHPGTDFLIRLEYELKDERVISADPGTLTTGPIFDTLDKAGHAVYALSAYCPTASVLVMTDGSLIVAPAGSVTVAVQRQYMTGPIRIEMRTAVYNSTAGAQNVSVKVWRRVGLA